MFNLKKEKCQNFCKKNKQKFNNFKKGAVKLSVDWIGDSIYWTNNEQGRIEQIGIDGRNRRTVIINLDKPHAIKVDPVAGHIFWSDYGAESPGPLMRADMSGKKAKPLLTQDSLGTRIRSITLDTSRRRIYFIELSANAIFEMGYEPLKKGRNLNSKGIKI